MRLWMGRLWGLMRTSPTVCLTPAVLVTRMRWLVVSVPLRSTSHSQLVSSTPASAGFFMPGGGAMQTKDFATKVKAAGPDAGLKEGQVRAVVSAFGNEDSVGDVVIPGAFEEEIGRASCRERV